MCEDLRVDLTHEQCVNATRTARKQGVNEGLLKKKTQEVQGTTKERTYACWCAPDSRMRLVLLLIILMMPVLIMLLCGAAVALYRTGAALCGYCTALLYGYCTALLFGPIG
jgi:hypothetical protein